MKKIKGLEDEVVKSRAKLERLFSSWKTQTLYLHLCRTHDTHETLLQLCSSDDMTLILYLFLLLILNIYLVIFDLVF